MPRSNSIALITLIAAFLIGNMMGNTCFAQTKLSFELEEGFVSLFNGKNLDGWRYLPTTEQQKKSRGRWQKNDPSAPPWPIVEEVVEFDGKTISDDGRFVAEKETLVVTVPPEGRKIQNLYTRQEFPGDFTLKLEFRAATGADSGVFIRGKQLQCRDYPNAGPYKELKQFKPNDWNELVVVVKGRVAHCSCNGEVLESEFKLPETGPIGVEGDQGKLEYRRIRIKHDDGKASFGLLKPTNNVDAWTFETNGGGEGDIKADGESIVITTKKCGDENWHVQAYQAGLTLEEGAEYTLSLEMKSPSSSTIVVQAMINEPDWNLIGLNQEEYIGKSFDTYEYSFTAENVAKNNNRVGIAVGLEEGSVVIKNMKLIKK